MSLLLYAIADAEPDAVSGSGLDQARLRAVGDPGLVAVVSEHAVPAPAPDTLWEYEQVLERLMEQHAVLPARFGSTVDDEPAARNMLASRREVLLGALRLVKGAVELGLRIAWRDWPSDASESGTAYMQSRLAQLRRARQIAAELGALEELARASRIWVAPRPELAALAAYLVDRSALGEFTARLARLDHALRDVELVCTGPWPPYSFVATAGSGGSAGPAEGARALARAPSAEPAG